MPDSVSASRAPLSAHLFDGATLLAQFFLFDLLVAAWDTFWIRTYLWVFLLFCGGLYLKRFDPAYVAGAERMGRKHPWMVGIGVYVAGLVVGALGVVSLISGAVPGLTGERMPMAVGIPLVIGMTFAVPVLHAWTMHRAGARRRAPLRPAAALGVRLGSSAAIFLLTLYLLSFVWRTLSEMQSQERFPLWFYPVVLMTTGILLALFYLPGRIHSLFEDPDSPANWWSMWITCAAAALFAVAGVHVGS